MAQKKWKPPPRPPQPGDAAFNEPGFDAPIIVGGKIVAYAHIRHGRVVRVARRADPLSSRRVVP